MNVVLQTISNVFHVVLILVNQLNGVRLERGGSLIISPIAVFEMSSLTVTVVPAMSTPFGFVVSAYLKKESRPSFADFIQAKVVAQFGGAVFNQIDAGQWFILIYNDGPDLERINIGVNLEGK